MQWGYPPGIPAIARGELINDALVDHLEALVAAGGFLEGAADAPLGTFRVVANSD